MIFLKILSNRSQIIFSIFSSASKLLLFNSSEMKCFSHFCCGYSLRAGGSFIGYSSIVVYSILISLCLIFMWILQVRIDDSEERENINVFHHFTSLLSLKSRGKHHEIETTLQELKSESNLKNLIYGIYIDFLLKLTA